MTFDEKETELYHHLIKHSELTPTEKEVLIKFFGNMEEFNNLDDALTDFKLHSIDCREQIYSLLADQIMIYDKRKEKEATL